MWPLSADPGEVRLLRGVLLHHVVRCVSYEVVAASSYESLLLIN